MDAFAGFPVAAFDFYDDLELDNTKSFWEAHKGLYADAVRAPMVALTEAMAPEFGAAKVFRPYRDVRFAKDKTPYKNHQGAFVAAAPATGWYVEIAAPGFRVGGGFYHAEADALARIRTGIDDERRGRELERLVADLEQQGFARGGDTLRTSPRGFDASHPRIDLLRHRSLVLGRSYGFDEVVHTPALLDRVRDDWRTLRPLIDWITRELR